MAFFRKKKEIPIGLWMKCPACGKLKLVRQIGTGAGVIFKGSGFYETDYKRSKASPPAASTDDGGTSETTSARETKSSSDAKSTSDAKSGGSSKDD